MKVKNFYNETESTVLDPLAMDLTMEAAMAAMADMMEEFGEHILSFSEKETKDNLCIGYTANLKTVKKRNRKATKSQNNKPA